MENIAWLRRKVGGETSIKVKVYLKTRRGFVSLEKLVSGEKKKGEK